jgi:hypothetical protein
MAKLGSPISKKFSIGTAELRIGPLSSANKLLQANSIGLVDNVTLEVAQESVDLLGGFPRVQVDTALVSQTASVTATLREYSRKNFSVMLGLGVPTLATDVATTASATGSAGGTSLTVTSATGLAEGDLIVVYKAGSSPPQTVQPELVQILKCGSIATNVITLDTDTPLVLDVAVGDIVYKANQLAVGNVQTTSYFSVTIIQQERDTGRPVGFTFWKAAIGGNMSWATNSTDFASTEMTLKILQPAAEEYDASGDALYHMRDLIPTHPMGLFFGGGG